MIDVTINNFKFPGSLIRSDEVQEQITRFLDIKNKIINYIQEHPELSEEKKYCVPPASTVMDSLHFADESFQFISREANYEEVDRTSSMYSGPFFCSQKFPQPMDVNGISMIPIVQLDLAWVNNLCDRLFPEGLLQLWLDSSWSKHVIRLIPKEAVLNETLVEFKWDSLLEVVGDSGNFKIKWPSDPACKLITGLNPVGMSCPQIGRNIDAFDYEVSDDFIELIDDLDWASPVLGAHLFGAFNDRQRGPADFIPNKLLMTFSDWGADGSAQIYYGVDKKDQITFTFSHCTR